VATPAVAERATDTSIYIGKRFSDHAPLTIDYDMELPAPGTPTGC